MNTFFAFFIALVVLSSVNAQSSDEPRCYQVGQMLHGMDLPAICAHSTHDYSVAYDIVDGCLKFLVPEGEVVTELELYSGARMTTPWEDCCPADSWLHNLDCTHVPPSGECCYDEDSVHVTGLPEHAARCVHDVLDYDSFVPSNGSVWWDTSDPSGNTHVEVYGDLHSNGCCEKFLYALECSPCN
jgi:hypothetical protein